MRAVGSCFFVMEFVMLDYGCNIFRDGYKHNYQSYRNSLQIYEVCVADIQKLMLLVAIVTFKDLGSASGKVFHTVF